MSDRQQEGHTAYIGLGSNLGQRRRILQRAIEALDSRDGIAVRQVSSFIETEPVGGPPQGPYINAAAELRTTLSPRELLEELLDVEDELGRVRTVHWGPRKLDLDLLLYEDQIIDEPGLQVPHPHMHKRPFVLDPLSEIAPEVTHPVLDKTVSEMQEEL